MKRGSFYVVIFSILANMTFAALEVENRIIGRQESYPYLYLRVTVRNPTPNKMDFDINIKDNYSKAAIDIKNQEISPQKDKIYNLALPMMRSPVVEIRDSGGIRKVAGSGWEVKSFLNICDISDWASEKEITDFSKSYHKSGLNVVSQLEPELLPDNWLCYSPFLSVFIKEIAYNFLSPPEKEALLQWVDAGGCLIVYGSDQNKEIKQMLGSIRFQSKSPLELNDIGRNIASSPWLDTAKTRGTLKNFPYMVKRSAGKYGGFVLATVFLIVAGPLNYSWWKKRKRIRMILVSLPVISLAFCLLIVLYFFTTQGFAKRGGSVSITLLDEKRDAGFTFSRHCLFSGLYPLGGFKFDQTTGFYTFGKTDNFTVDLSSLFHLRSGLFTPSVNFHYFTATPFKTRERLVFDPVERSVTNGFEQRIEGLIWNEGGLLMIARDLAPGQKKKLDWYEETSSSQYISAFSLNIFYKEFLSESENNFDKAIIANFINQPFMENRVKYMVRFKDNLPSVETGIRISAKKNSPFLVVLENATSLMNQEMDNPFVKQ